MPTGPQQSHETGEVYPHSTKISLECPLNSFSLTPTPWRSSLQSLVLGANPLSYHPTSHQNQCVRKPWSLVSHFSVLSFLRADHLPSLPLCPAVSAQGLVCRRHAQVQVWGAAMLRCWGEHLSISWVGDLPLAISSQCPFWFLPIFLNHRYWSI